MPLEFPTLAEQCLAEWKACTKTTSLVTLAAARDGERFDSSDPADRYIEFFFPDDTSLRIRGTGAGHSVKVLLP